MSKTIDYLKLLVIALLLVSATYAFAKIIRSERTERNEIKKLEIERLKLEIKLKKIQLGIEP